MIRELNKFVSVFRELEHKQYNRSREEEKQLEELKVKLSSIQPNKISSGYVQRTIAIASLYPQTGSSFIASNLAYYHACSQIYTSLCELPSISPYLYFSLDFERRGYSSKSELIIPFQQGLLRVKPTSPHKIQQELSQSELINWFMRNHKECSLLFLDISHVWQVDQAIQIGQWVDEIWFVLDDNIPRLASLVMSQEAPNLWGLYPEKIRIIANKWNENLVQRKASKQVEGTLSLWETDIKRPSINCILPLLDSRKISQSYLAGDIYLERYPEESEIFAECSKVMINGGDL